jgi:Secretion system C-terminal sorting domain
MNQLKLFLGALGLLCASYASTAQTSCGCDVTITPTTLAPYLTYRPWSPGKTGPSYLNIQPGQTVCLTAGNYNQIRFADFHGTIDSPIIFKNCGGQVNIATNDYHTMSFDNCRYIKLTGTGDNSLTHGISLNGSRSGYSGLVVVGLSTDVEVDHLNVTQASFAGMMIKQDPTCSGNTWRDSFTMYNIKVHDNIVRNTGSEGLYIGNSFWQQGLTRTCNGQSVVVYPHRILGLKVYNNIVKNTGWEAIQYGCSPDAEVYNNEVDSSGQSNVSQQCNGIQLGAGSGGSLYNNTIRNVKCGAIVAIGFVENTNIYNNLIVGTSDGMFIDTRDSIQNNMTLVVANNTLSNITNVGLKIYDYGLNYYQTVNGARTFFTFPKNYTPIVKNNIIIGPYWGFQVLGAAPQHIDSAKNYILNTPYSSPPSFFTSNKTNLFSDTTDYLLSSTSSLIDWGLNVTSLGITQDRFGLSRPQGSNFDIGAHELLYNPPFIPPMLSTHGTAYDLVVYPSIASSQITIKVPPSVKSGVYRIINAQGRIVLNKHYAASMGSEFTIDIQNLESGLYVLGLFEQNRPYTAKFVKQ